MLPTPASLTATPHPPIVKTHCPLLTECPFTTQNQIPLSSAQNPTSAPNLRGVKAKPFSIARSLPSSPGGHPASRCSPSGPSPHPPQGLCTSAPSAGLLFPDSQSSPHHPSSLQERPSLITLLKTAWPPARPPPPHSLSPLCVLPNTLQHPAY